MISSNIKLHELSTGRPPLVATAMTMLKQYLFQFVPSRRLFGSLKTILTSMSRTGTRDKSALRSSSAASTLPALISTLLLLTARPTSCPM